MLFFGGAPKGPVGLADTHPRTCLGGPRAMAGQLGWKYSLFIPCVSPFFAQKKAILDLKPRFSWKFCDLLENSCGFPGISRPCLAQTWARLGRTRIWSSGKIRHVSESTSFSSPTGPQRAHQTPRRPPQTPPEGFRKIVFFSNLPGGVWGGLLGYFRGSGGQLGLKSLSIR